MEKNQNVKNNQKSESTSQQEKFEDRTKKKLINPTNPTLKQDNQYGSGQNNQQQKSSNTTSTQNKTNSKIQDSEEREEGATDLVPSEKSGSQKTKKAIF